MSGSCFGCVESPKTILRGFEMQELLWKVRNVRIFYPYPALLALLKTLKMPLTSHLAGAFHFYRRGNELRGALFFKMEFFENGVWYRPDWKCVVKYIVWAFQRTFKRRKIWKIRDFVFFQKKYDFQKWRSLHRFEKSVVFSPSLFTNLRKMCFSFNIKRLRRRVVMPWPPIDSPGLKQQLLYA